MQLCQLEKRSLTPTPTAARNVAYRADDFQIAVLLGLEQIHLRLIVEYQTFWTEREFSTNTLTVIRTKPIEVNKGFTKLINVPG